MEPLESGVEYVIVNKEQISLIKPLWKNLNRHHEEKSIYFKEKYTEFTFEERINKLFEKASRGDIRIEIAKLDGMKIGYCLSSIINGSGEVESIYIDPDYRGYKVGERLIKSALNWMEEKSTKLERIVVASGNDEVLSFYHKFGFQPEYVTLRLVK